MRYKLYRDGEHVNTIVSSESYVTDYCERMCLTFEKDFLPPAETEKDGEANA